MTQTFQARYTGPNIPVADVLRELSEIRDRLLTEAKGSIQAARSRAAARIRSTRHRVKSSLSRHVKREVGWQTLLAVQTISDLRSLTIRMANEECLNLVMRICEEVIGDSIREDRAVLANLVARELGALAQRDPIEVKVHPERYEETKHRLRDRKFSDLRLSISESLPPDTARIETSAGAVDLSWELHLERIHRSLKEELELQLQTKLSEIRDAGHL